MVTTPSALLDRRQHINKLIVEMKTISDEISSSLEYAECRPHIKTPNDAVEIVLYDLGIMEQEEMWVMLLSTRNEVLHIQKTYRGTVNKSSVRAAEIFRSAIIENAPAIIIFHNHPSGDPEPSPDDVFVTRQLVEVGKLLDIEILDHIIVAHGKHVSLKERRLGF